jgi:dephospho-CoA kinase
MHIGLTGGIGSGKSTVAAVFARLGVCVIDTDAIARELTRPGGAAIDAVAAEFGRDYIEASGALDRARMRALAFTDASSRQRLEAILHPLIGAETARRAAAATGHVLFDVPLLVESGRWRARVDKVLVIDCSAPVQAERVATRPGWTREAALAVIAQQAPRALRRASADAVIHNDGISPADLEHAVRRLWAHWCG